jgi:preprotein translocase subunit SecY
VAERPAPELSAPDLSGADGAAQERPAPGWLRALVVGGLIVDAVLAAAFVSFLLPSSLGDVVFRSPLLILVLIAGTAFVLWTITRPRPLDR